MYISCGPCTLLFLLLFIQPALSDTQSIISEAPYSSLPGCVQNCYRATSQGSTVVGDQVGLQLGCGVTFFSFAQNSCYCDPAREPIATSYISNCANSCSVNKTEVDSAVGLYVGYCASHGGNLTLPASTSATTTQGAFSSGAISSGTSSSGASSSTPTLNTTPTPKKNSNTATIAGAVVGGIGGLILILVAIWWALRWRKARESNSGASSSRVTDTNKSATAKKSSHGTAGVGELKFTAKA